MEHVGKRTGAHKILAEKPEERDHLEYLDVDGRIT